VDRPENTIYFAHEADRSRWQRDDVLHSKDWRRKNEKGGNLMRSTSFTLPRLPLAAAAMLAVGGLLATFPAQAQYPAKPIRVFLPFAAGGIGDITFRLVTSKISERTDCRQDGRT
jgi:hypothetical protein